jgi:2-polyprenyl-6-hydroxyphenyl methylase/3-demethylubiquinone-9 3-methyltransferase
MSAQPASAPGPGTSIDPQEVTRFDALAERWWDPRGPMAPLHRFNPQRLRFIREQALRRFGRDSRALRPFEGLRCLDIGCGAGLLAEPVRRMGFQVVAVDAAEKNIGAAQAHAAQAGLDIDYRAATAEQLLVEGEPPFDLVLNMEVVEHVADPGDYLRSTARLLKPGGLMVVATLNRTARSYALAILGAEHVLRWLPVGTHDWRRFLRPGEIREHLQAEPVAVEGPFGVGYNPLTNRWGPTPDAAVNYMMTVIRLPDAEEDR